MAELNVCSKTLLGVFLRVLLLQATFAYDIDDSKGLGRVFDGIGGISGGGATSRLLVNYSEPYRSQILDYLFKPNFGASLHILKVEIGGDAQSTDGTETSHMHNADDENYQRGYEWWLMKEAKKRNPDIKLYGLPWAFPAWIGNGTTSPYHNPQLTATYVTKWITGAKTHHNLTIDYVGIFNERDYNVTYIEVLRQVLDANGLQHTKIVAADGNGKHGWDITNDILKYPKLASVVEKIGYIWNERLYDIPYIMTLRKTLDQNGFQDVKIVASDAGWGIVVDLNKQPDFNKTVDYVGAHYPGTKTVADALKTNKPLWASEDYSTFNDNTGGGCWARILNQNYVNGHMTSTISWNLIASYYDDLSYKRDGLMTAVEPWSGHYELASPIFLSAHTTQFVFPGWTYFQHGAGVGHLDKGGSYVALASESKMLTIIIETMTHDHSVCIRPALPKYTVEKQNATFKLKGSYMNITELYVWHSKLGFQGEPTTLFEKLENVKVVDGQFSIQLDLDEVYTLTTMATGNKGHYPDSPKSEPFPFPYKDDFEGYAEFSEASYFADQSGVFEIHQTNDVEHGKVMRQMVPQRPIVWCNDSDHPTSVIGNHNWTNVNVSSDVFLEDGSGGVLLAARVSLGSCKLRQAVGVFLWISPGEFEVTADHERWIKIHKGNCDMQAQKWYRVSLYVKDKKAVGTLNGKQLFDVTLADGSGKGWIGIGTTTHNYAQFDNFNIDPAK